MIAANEMNILNGRLKERNSLANVAPSGGDFFSLKASILFFYFQFKHATKQNG